MSRKDGELLLAAADEIIRLQAEVETLRESKRKEAEYLGLTLEQMAVRLAAMNTRLESELHVARMQAHLLRLQDSDRKLDIGPNALKGSK